VFVIESGLGVWAGLGEFMFEMIIAALLGGLMQPGGEATDACPYMQDDGEREGCAPPLGDGRVLLLHFVLDAEENEWGEATDRVEFRVVNAAGAVEQSFGDVLESERAYPHVEDIDQDGDLDLFVPQMMGMVNSTDRLWVQTPDGFVYAGETFGISLNRAQDGLYENVSRASASERYHEFYTLADNQLIHRFTLHAGFRMEPCEDKARCMVWFCRAEDAGSLVDLSLTVAETEARYCPAEPELD
jgi:hypothetical protein